MTGPTRLAFAAFFFFYFCYIGLMSPYASLYFAHLDFTAFEIAVLMSMFQVTRMIGPFFWGWLADMRRDRLGIMRTTAVMATLLFPAIFFLEGFAAFLIWMFVLNIVISSLMPLGEAATVHALQKENALTSVMGA